MKEIKAIIQPATLDKALLATRAGQKGNGKIFVMDCKAVVRIRTTVGVRHCSTRNP